MVLFFVGQILKIWLKKEGKAVKLVEKKYQELEELWWSNTVLGEHD